MATNASLGGKNKRRLIALFSSRIAIPPGGSVADGMEVLIDPERLKRITLQAIQMADTAIAAIRLAPDNPYGDDEETIAGAIVAEVEKRLPD